MKKKIFVGMLALSFAVIATLNVFISNQDSILRLSCSTLEGLASESSSSESFDCESSVDDRNTIIIVTVCNRKTGFFDAIVKIRCGRDATTSCQFSNGSV